jgi:hypothetical protein
LVSSLKMMAVNNDHDHQATEAGEEADQMASTSDRDGHLGTDLVETDAAAARQV